LPVSLEFDNRPLQENETMAIAIPHHHARSPTLRRATAAGSSACVAGAYDHVGDDYGRYADGDGAEDAGEAANRFAHADTIVWQAISAAIDRLNTAGVSQLRVLDAGCGPGTWALRIAARAHELGLGVQAIGFDISSGQLTVARNKAERFRARVADGGIDLTFRRHDLARRCPGATAIFTSCYATTWFSRCFAPRHRRTVPGLAFPRDCETWATKPVDQSLPVGIGRQVKRNASWHAHGYNKAGISSAVYLPAR
jgi:hypothetical protein